MYIILSLNLLIKTIFITMNMYIFSKYFLKYNYMSITFKTKYDFETRKKESDKIKTKYPNRFPIIVNKAKKCDLEDIERSKFLVPGDLTIGQFIFIIRKRIKLSETDSLFLFILIYLVFQKV